MRRTHRHRDVERDRDGYRLIKPPRRFHQQAAARVRALRGSDVRRIDAGEGCRDASDKCHFFKLRTRVKPITAARRKRNKGVGKRLEINGAAMGNLENRKHGRRAPSGKHNEGKGGGRERNTGNMVNHEVTSSSG